LRYYDLKKVDNGIVAGRSRQSRVDGNNWRFRPSPKAKI